jgi:hypothetical protein
MGRNDSEFRSRYPSIPVTTLAEMVRRDFVISAEAGELAAASSAPYLTDPGGFPDAWRA